MPELLLNPGDLCSRLERDPGERVTKGVKGAIAAVLTLARNAGSPHRRVEHLADDVIRSEMAACLILEDKPVPATADSIPLSEELDGLGGQVDDTTLAALRHGLAGPCVVGATDGDLVRGHRDV